MVVVVAVLAALETREERYWLCSWSSWLSCAVSSGSSRSTLPSSMSFGASSTLRRLWTE